MNTAALRNIAILLVLTAAVFALPGGGTTAAIVQAVIGILFAVGIWLLLMRIYREHRLTIDGLGDTYRGILYGSLAGLLFLAAAARKWFDSGPLTLLWIVFLGACVYGLVAVWRHWREYA